MSLLFTLFRLREHFLDPGGKGRGKRRIEGEKNEFEDLPLAIFRNYFFPSLF